MNEMSYGEAVEFLRELLARATSEADRATLNDVCQRMLSPEVDVAHQMRYVMSLPVAQEFRAEWESRGRGLGEALRGLRDIGRARIPAGERRERALRDLNWMAADLYARYRADEHARARIDQVVTEAERTIRGFERVEANEVVWNMPDGSRIVGIDEATEYRAPETWDEAYRRGAQRAAERLDQQIMADARAFLSPDAPLEGHQLPQGPAHPNYQTLGIQYTYDPIDLRGADQVSLDDGVTWGNPDEMTAEEVDGIRSPVLSGDTIAVNFEALRDRDGHIWDALRLEPRQSYRFGQGIAPRLTEERQAGLERGADLLAAAKRTAYQAIQRAFETDFERRGNHAETVAVETTNGVLFIHLNLQPNGGDE